MTGDDRERPSELTAKARALDSGWRSQVLEVHRPSQPAVSRTYTRVAPVYEFWARLTESRARNRVLELAAIRPREHVLEVATGTGVQLVQLARRNQGGRTVGVEFAPGMIAQTRRRLGRAGLLERVTLVKGDALALSFEAASFDLAVNSYMLDLLPRADIPRALSELGRVLRPGGRLVLCNMTKGERPWHRFWDAVYARGMDLTANCRGVLAAPVLAELGGFVDIKREYVAQLLFPTEIVTAMKAGATSSKENV